MAAADLEFVLRHEDDAWVARGAGLTARGADFAALDADLAAQLAACGGAGPVRVFMGFDFDSLPGWLRQYASHYFNRRLTLEVRP